MKKESKYYTVGAWFKSLLILVIIAALAAGIPYSAYQYAVDGLSDLDVLSSVLIYFVTWQIVIAVASNRKTYTRGLIKLLYPIYIIFTALVSGTLALFIAAAAVEDVRNGIRLDATATQYTYMSAAFLFIEAALISAFVGIHRANRYFKKIREDDIHKKAIEEALNNLKHEHEIVVSEKVEAPKEEFHVVPIVNKWPISYVSNETVENDTSAIPVVDISDATNIIADTKSVVPEDAAKIVAAKEPSKEDNEQQKSESEKAPNIIEKSEKEVIDNPADLFTAEYHIPFVNDGTTLSKGKEEFNIKIMNGNFTKYLVDHGFDSLENDPYPTFKATVLFDGKDDRGTLMYKSQIVADIIKIDVLHETICVKARGKTIKTVSF